jgi:Ca2+-binding EF-hand superfamily protein
MKAPGWTVVPKHEVEKRTWCTHCCIEWCGGEHAKHVPSKQEALFWFEHLGPWFHRFLMKLHIVIQSIYVAILGFVFIPIIFISFGILYGCLFTVAALTPVAVQWIGFYSTLVCNMSHMESTGLMLKKKRLAATIRHQKTAKAMKIIMHLTHAGAGLEGDEEVNYDVTDPHVIQEQKEIAHMFELYDKEHIGVIDRKTCIKLAKALGMNLSEHGEKAMLVKLDKKETDKIGKKAFIHFSLQRRHTHPEDEHKETARKIFNMFDTDKSGTITVHEFVEGMNKANSGLTDDELFALVKEIDEENTGEIDLEHFEKFIEECCEEGEGHH